MLDKSILIDSMPDLFNFDGGDYCRPEHECIELPFRIGVFLSSDIPFSLHSAVLLQWLLLADAPQGWSSSLYFGLLAGTFF